MIIPGNWCAECGRDDAGPRQLCATCEPLYPLAGADVVDASIAAIEVQQILPAITDPEICLCGCQSEDTL